MQLNKVKVICIGSALVDTIASSPRQINWGDDVPGYITSNVGGVAFNICQQLALSQLKEVELLTALGKDAKGRKIIKLCDKLGIITKNIYKSNIVKTDSYVAIEDVHGLKAAIADVKNVELHSENLLKPLVDGKVIKNITNFKNLIILDGNLSQDSLLKTANNKNYLDYDIRIVPASPSKATRLKPFLKLPNVTIYCNKKEAEKLLDLKFENTLEAATHLLRSGLGRAIVTDAHNNLSEASLSDKPITFQPPNVKKIYRATGAGDYFLACHIINDLKFADKKKALKLAANSAASYVQGEH